MVAGALTPSPRALIVDLNNFARYPTVAIGYIIAALRDRGLSVDLFSPLSVGVSGVTREAPVRPWSLLNERLRYRTAISRSKLIRSVRSQMARRRMPSNQQNNQKILSELERQLDDGPDVILISSYLMYFELCENICRLAARRGIPAVIGGPYFSEPSVVGAWLGLKGLSALFSGEAEPYIARLLKAVVNREKLGDIPGVWEPEGSPARLVPPVSNLDDLAFPDYSDFPWHRYPERIVPMITGRGCSWGVCNFCSDVTSSMGRTFRSRSPGNVLDELEYQAQACSASKFIFTDLKLNSSLPVWEGLIDEASKRVPGVEWAGSVHVGSQGDNGLSKAALRAARASGLVRITTGLESGSQPLLDRMNKGTDLESTSNFLTNASDADISVRTTMIIGYPDERPEDLRQTADFLNRHTDSIERVLLNRLAIIAGTRLHRQVVARPEKFPDLVDLAPNPHMATLSHYNQANDAADYRRAINQVLAAVHRINRRPLRPRARSFEGVM